MAENREVKDEVMEQAAGGMIDEYSGNTATITAVFTANPHPDDPMFTDLWEECVQSNFRVYQIGKSGYAVAGPNLPEYFVGDLVALNSIRGSWGWEIEGVFDGPVVL